MQASSHEPVTTPTANATFLRIAEATFDQDLELHHRIRRFLINCEPHNTRNLRIDVQGGHVVLRGRVQTSDQRRVCVGAARRVAGVLTVTDELEFSS